MLPVKNNTKQVISLTINGYTHELYVRNAATLLQTLRKDIGLTGAKNGCSNGDCGSCTILIDGNPMNACHMLTIEAVGKDIQTIEGLTDSKVKDAFINHWALQCGYCTPAFILNIHALIHQHPQASEETIDDWMDSNICRCTGYEEIKQVVQSLIQPTGEKHV